MIETLKRLVKKNRQMKRMAEEMRRKVTFHPEIGEILPIAPRVCSLKGKRLNLVVPSINQEHIFGGIATAVKFFTALGDHFGYEQRIITVDAGPGEDDLRHFPAYCLVKSETEKETAKQITPFNDRYGKTLAIRENDLFVCTSWWTAYLAQDLIRWQRAYYDSNPGKMIYLIQDYEPGFYPWSSRYGLAESTYRSDLSQIAVFNSQQLYDYFQERYDFAESYYFDPVLHRQLKTYLLQQKNELLVKKKQMLFYGRPSVERNAFEIGVDCLRRWAAKTVDAVAWQVFSVGEKHPDLDLGNGCTLCSLGKVTIEEYARLMVESYVGISLMVSPHPSYPPLEMATFGMKVITNRYANKDLALFHENIQSLESLDPQRMAVCLSEICHDYEPQGFTLILDHPYVEGRDSFAFIKTLCL